jgi:hypothetical protein
MSAGLTQAAVVQAASQTFRVDGTFTGGKTALAPGPILSIDGLSGKLGDVPFHASVSGQIFGYRFVSGFIQLSIPQSKSTLVAELGRGPLSRSGKTEQLKLLTIVTQATGAYSDVVGSVGKSRFQFTAGQPQSTSKTQSESASKPHRGGANWTPKTVQFTLLLGKVTLKAYEVLVHP